MLIPSYIIANFGKQCNKQILNRHFLVKLNRHIKVETIGL